MNTETFGSHGKTDVRKLFRWVFFQVFTLHKADVWVTIIRYIQRSGDNITLGRGTSQIFENQLITAVNDGINSENFVGLTVDSNIEVNGYWKFLRSTGKCYFTCIL